jgi:hypothetical protein
VSRPGDGSRDGRQVTDNWWLLLVLLVVVLDLLNLVSVLLEEQVVFGLEAILERRSVEDALELAEETERVNNVGNVGEVLVDVVLEEGLNVRDVDVKFDEITVEAVVTVFEETMVLRLELLDVSSEDIKDGLDVLKVVLLEGLELLDSAEQVNELGDTSAEKVEASKDLSRREVELFGLGHVFEALLGELVLGQVSLVETEALLHYFDKLVMGDQVLFPKDGVVHGTTFLFS